MSLPENHLAQEAIAALVDGELPAGPAGRAALRQALAHRRPDLAPGATATARGEHPGPGAGAVEPVAPGGEPAL